MMRIIGQVCGIVATACCAVLPLFRKKWMMLLFSMIANILFGLNQIFLGEISSACLLYIVTVVQTLLMMWHVHKESEVTRAENIVFLVLFIIVGILGLKSWLHVLPIFGAIFSMFATFQRSEQSTRWLILFNAICWASYFLIGWAIEGTLSTNVFAELLAITTTVIALIKYGLEKKKKLNAK